MAQLSHQLSSPHCSRGRQLAQAPRFPPLQCPKASLTLQGLAPGSPDDKMASARGRMCRAYLGVMGIEGLLRLVGDLVCRRKTLCFGTVRSEGIVRFGVGL